MHAPLRPAPRVQSRAAAQSVQRARHAPAPAATISRDDRFALIMQACRPLADLAASDNASSVTRRGGGSRHAASFGRGSGARQTRRRPRVGRPSALKTRQPKSRATVRCDCGRVKLAEWGFEQRIYIYLSDVMNKCFRFTGYFKARHHLIIPSP